MDKDKFRWVNKENLQILISDFLLENDLSEMFLEFAAGNGYSPKELGLRQEVLDQAYRYKDSESDRYED